MNMGIRLPCKNHRARRHGVRSMARIAKLCGTKIEAQPEGFFFEKSQAIKFPPPRRLKSGQSAHGLWTFDDIQFNLFSCFTSNVSIK